MAIIDFPDYHGSDERQTYILPVPYVIYRGEFLKIDHKKVCGLFFKSDKAELDVSLNGSVPVKSSSNRTRHGMSNYISPYKLDPP